jgi:predicted DNA-binding transcriptional regulator AlpA
MTTKTETDTELSDAASAESKQPSWVLLTDGQLAERLQVSIQTVRRMWFRKELPAPIKVGFVNRWRESDIDQWVADLKPNELYEDGKERRLQ